MEAYPTRIRRSLDDCEKYCVSNSEMNLLALAGGCRLQEAELFVRLASQWAVGFGIP